MGIGLATSLLAESTFLHVSFDPTRELYEDINKSFLKSWKEKKGEEFSIQQSHGGSGKQARAVIDGLEADVVSLALSYDIDNIASKSKLIDANWQSKLPNKSTPYYSTIIFLVRKSNPKKIKDWDDIVKPGISVITPNPKTSGGARWNYLAAYGYAKRKYKSEEKATDFVKALFQNTSVLDTGARGSTTTFVNRGIGDVLITWENEAKLALDEEKRSGKNSLEVVYPSESIRAETPVAVVTKTATEKGNLEKATAYLEFLFTNEGQTIIAKHFFRPIDPKVSKSSAKDFPNIKLFSLSDLGETWDTAQKKHFADGGVFDAIYKTK
ncbi:sulfate ABC transporter substrate-binding protein [Leptospira levettii]|uniref:Sulfate ABC transporter substrate-binding protein n=2 Tax=Leptospira levettii TaxID=2023178 RepID=A0AAW5VAF7_9LEPT|nr:sulfate ABC transporter substrate-binding protein [Leptospira levettii]MCW7511508.1 sulfate ABC transporter substrate-binding protein [Leptospira levettii]MCW7515263.1 sulfate ABC transporter substrate-binding protein [Leptospira levettii]